LLVITLTIFVCGVLYVSGVRVLKVLAIGAPILFVCMVARILTLIAISPNPRTEATVDQLRNWLFK